ncbi:MAG TPA: flagellar basal body rod C-terminal domain-containing protein [Opitutaceae bacterium]|nr:flagellar basal body rod C-terminal domain-containing protein [Opitutaceae bacterium]
MISPTPTPSSANAVARAQEGMRRGLARFGTAAEEISRGNLDPSNVVGQIEGQRTYEMNAAVVRTADEMLGTLLDIKV